MVRSDFYVEADTIEGLFESLGAAGTKVDARGGAGKRTKEQRELFCLRRYALTLAASGHWIFPCAIKITESPDFLITFPTGVFGLEITEATTPEYQKLLTQSACCPDNVVPLDDGLVGDEPERAWCADVISAVDRKAAKVGNYQRAVQHNLLVYSNHLSDSHRGFYGHPEYRALRELAMVREQAWKMEYRFGDVSVLDGDTHLLYLTGECHRLKVNE